MIVVRLTADAPGSISFTAQLRGERNQAHSNYATDYFRMDGSGSDGLVVRGKSADYLGVAGQAALPVAAQGGAARRRACASTTTASSSASADAVTLLVAAATNFVNYKDVSADPDARVDAVMTAAAAKPFEAMRAAHVARAPAAVPARVD